RAGEIDVHDDGCRVAQVHRSKKFLITGEGPGTHAEKLQLANHMAGALMILKGDVNRLAQRGHLGRRAARVAVLQAGTGKSIDQLAERRDDLAGEAASIVIDVIEAVLYLERKLMVLGLFEALGKPLQPLIGFSQGGMIGGVPLVALNLLPDFQHFAGLVNDPLGEVLLEFFLIRHFYFLSAAPVHAALCWRHAITCRLVPDAAMVAWFSF